MTVLFVPSRTSRESEESPKGLHPWRVSIGFRESVWERIQSGEGSPEILLAEPVGIGAKIRYGLVGASAAAAFLFGVNYLFSSNTHSSHSGVEGNSGVEGEVANVVPADSSPVGSSNAGAGSDPEKIPAQCTEAAQRVVFLAESPVKDGLSTLINVTKKTLQDLDPGANARASIREQQRWRSHPDTTHRRKCRRILNSRIYNGRYSGRKQCRKV